jgi:ankyrin repeat protein
MKPNRLYDIEYAVREKNKKKIKKILKNNPEEILKIQVHTILDIIHFNEFNLLETIIKSINNKLKKYILSINEIIIKLLNSSNIEFINKYFKYISWNKLIDDKYIVKLCINTNNFELIELIYKIYKTQPKYSLLYDIFINYINNNIKVNVELIKILIKIDKNLVNERSNNKLVICSAALTNNLELLKLLKQAGMVFYYDDFNILNYYIQGINNFNYLNYKTNNDIILYLLNNDININICNYDLWLPAHYIFSKPNEYTLEVRKIILEKTNNLNIQNTSGNTVLHYLILNDNIDNYKDILVKKELDIFIKNKGLYTPLSIAISKKTNLTDIVVKSFLNQIKGTIPKFTKEEAINYIFKNKTSIYKKTNNDNNDIIIGDYNYTNHNKYNPNFINTQLFFVVLLQKYNNLGIPYLPNNKIKFKDKIYQDESFDSFIQLAKKYLYYSEEFMYLKIYWADENNYLITPNIGEAIKYIFKFKKYVIVFIHIYNKYLSHANVLIFDRDKKIIVHFEPHGKLSSYVGKFYETLKNIFKKELKGFKYIPPSEYLPVDAYQSMYDAQNVYHKKVGDVEGYCGAWCFWFIELYINNNKYDLKSLISKSIKKLINTKYSFLDHIRNYANYLNDKNTELLLNYGIPNNYVNDKIYTENVVNNILDKISFNIKQLNY